MTSKSDNLRYSIIPARAITDPNITAQALRVLALLGRHAADNGWCRRSQVRMAKELACSRGTIQNALDLLIGQENGTGYVERREETRPNVEPVAGRHPHCSYSYRVRLDLDDEGDTDRASRLARVRADRKAGGATPEKHAVPVCVAPLTEPSLGERPLANTLAPVGAGESENVASLGKGNPERWPEFRSTVAKTWLDGFPADNEVACRKQFERLTRVHAADLIIACAALHGAELQRRQAARGKNSKQHARLPSNWLQNGDWEGYVPQAQDFTAREADAASAIGRVRRALGEGLFGVLRDRLADGEIVMLDGMTLEGDAALAITRPFQRRLLEKHIVAIERQLGGHPSITLVPKVGAS